FRLAPPVPSGSSSRPHIPPRSNPAIVCPCARPPHSPYMVAVQPVCPLAVPFICLPETSATYSSLPALNFSSGPLSRPSLIGTVVPPVLRVPSTNWNFCVSVSSPSGVFQVPSTLAGTVHIYAVQ